MAQSVWDASDYQAPAAQVQPMDFWSPSIADARRVIANLAMNEGEVQFAREVLAGAWDHRNDVQSVMLGTFKPRQIVKG